MDGEFLSEIIDLSEVGDRDQLHLIVAPCGSGKTTLAFNCLAAMYGNPERTLYLIDTVAGQDQLLQNSQFRLYDKDWRENFADAPLKDDGKIVVMTYARFGTLCKYFLDWYVGLDTIICDEIHKLIEMMTWSRAAKIPDEDNIYQIAWGHIFLAFHLERVPAVFGLTATPQALYDDFYDENSFFDQNPQWLQEKIDSFIYLVPLNGDPRHYEQKNTEYYYDLSLLCHRLPADKKGVIYVPRISQMTNCIDVLTKRGLRAVGIWSQHNQGWKMTAEQHAVRKFIIENAAIPDDIDVLLINKSCETSINIKSYIDYMVVHSCHEDTQVQAIGRYRHDLDLVYLHDPDVEDRIILPDKMLNTPLFKENIVAYIQEQNLRDKQGHMLKQPTFLKVISMSGYKVIPKKKKGGKRYNIIIKQESDTQNH